VAGTAIVLGITDDRADHPRLPPQPYLVLLAFAVASAACFATLDMAERQSHCEDRLARRQWRILGACCLAGGIWAMHFISMLAFQAPGHSLRRRLTGLSC
jgi:NO-binding membrane sensor protein with MHYT domain